jgi:hypothetical protein
MSNEPIDADLQKFVQKEKRRLHKISEEERRKLIQQQIDAAINLELAEEREESLHEAELVSEEIARDPVKERARARDAAKSIALLLLLLLLILWLIAAASGRTDLLPIPGSQASPTFTPQLQGNGETGARVSTAGGTTTNMPPLGSLDTPAPAIGARFRSYYDLHGGEPVFGRAISPEMESNGRMFQWFERARLEEWPEYAGTPYGVQGGRLGAEFTTGITFPTQVYFVSRPDARYFAETGHGLSDRFLRFWDQHGGIDMIGYPISDQVQEILPDKQIHTVQYFERGRIEYHPQLAGTPFEMQLGLLGRALYLKESKPNIIPSLPPRPTAVPFP